MEDFILELRDAPKVGDVVMINGQVAKIRQADEFELIIEGLSCDHMLFCGEDAVTLLPSPVGPIPACQSCEARSVWGGLR
jgi:hypothetical protein